MKNTSNNRLIIINRMYAGGYLSEAKNIGHEIINLIRSDPTDSNPKGSNYIWLNSNGKCEMKRLDGYDEVVVLMVRQYGTRQWQVLGKAIVDIDEFNELANKYKEQIKESKYQKKNKSEDEIINEIQKNYIENENKITYMGTPLNKIFSNNYYRGKNQDNTSLYFTFKAKNVFLPIVNKENADATILDISEKKIDKNGKEIIGIKASLSTESLRMFLTPNKKETNESTYEFFSNVIDEKTYDASGKKIEWENENTTTSVTEDDAKSSNCFNEDYFLKIINEEDRELSFSNLLAYFLSNKEILNKFVSDFLKIKDFKAEGCEITREEENIDLLISSPSHQIIIENKIHSNLIFEKKDISKKLEKYYKENKDEKNDINKTLSETEKEIKNKLPADKTHSQIDRYYAYAVSKAIRWSCNIDNVKGFVLVPLYAKNKIEKELENGVIFQNEFEIKTYADLYKTFKEIQEGAVTSLTEKEKLYLNEFLMSMQKHKKEYDNSLEEEMRYRFFQHLKSEKK